MVSDRTKARVKLGILAALLVTLGLILGMRREIEKQSRKVEPTEPDQKEGSEAEADKRLTNSDGFVGVIVSRQSVEIAPKMEGTLATVDVRIGDRVQQGAVIATLDKAMIKKDVSVAEAAAKGAKSDERKARAELADIRAKRDSTRRIRQYVSATELTSLESQFLGAVSKLESAKATVQERQERVKYFQETLANAEIRAPFAGEVAVRYADPGAIVSTSKPVVRLVSDDRFLRFAVPEEERSLVQRGKTITAVIESQNIRVPALIETVSPEVDAVSGTVIVEAALKEPERWKEKLPSGSVARVYLASG